MLVNGTAANSINADDRGFAYGDGVFRTFRIKAGVPLHWPRHYQKLAHDCAALSISPPDGALLLAEINQLVAGLADGVVKIIITRGSSIRGYSAPANQTPTRVVCLSPLPHYPENYYQDGVGLHMCATRLGHQPRLAGIKHLNRLENVLAASEWQDAGLAEGLMLDIAGNVIGGTRSNLFMCLNGELITPDISQSGIAGVQRERIFSWARQQGLVCNTALFSVEELQRADEIFLVNSVFGVWPVRSFPGYQRSSFPMSKKIQEWFEHEDY